MNFIRNRVTIFALCALVLILCYASMSGCTQNKADGKENDAVTVVMPKTSENERGFDPIYGWAVSEHTHDPIIHSTLFKTDGNLNVVNDLATNYSYSSDSTRLNISIRDDILFSDGEKLSAKDVAFTITKMKENSSNAIDLTNVDSAIAIDDTHIEIIGTSLSSCILYTLSTVGIVKSEGYDASTYGKNPIGSGLYKLKSWNVGQSATFVYNDKYYGEIPSLKTINILFMDEDAARAAVLSGNADIAYTSSSLPNNEIKGYEIQAVKSNDTRGISLPCVDSSQGGNDTTSNLAVRQAINLCLNRQTIVDNCLNGYGSAAFSVCDNTPWANSSLKFSQNIDLAKEILDKAGFKESENNERCSFNLYYASSDSTRQSLANEFANQVKQIGIKVNLIGTNWDEIYAHQYSDAVLWGWGSNSPLELCNILKSDGSCNFPQFRSSFIDELLSDEKYIEAQNEADLNKASSWAWLCNVDHLYYVKSTLDIGDQQIHPHGHGWSLLNNISQWKWY